jgi:hypothetical protein
MHEKDMNSGLLGPKHVLFIFFGTGSHESAQTPVLAPETRSGRSKSLYHLLDTLGVTARSFALSLELQGFQKL